MTSSPSDSPFPPPPEGRGPEAGRGNHLPPITGKLELSLAWWYQLIFLAGSAASFLVLTLVWSGVSRTPIIVGLLGGLVGMRSLKLTINSYGIDYAHRAAKWEDVDLVKGRFGVVYLRSTTSGLSRFKRVNVILRSHEWDWRSGQIGGAIRHWQPRLLREIEESK